MHKNFYLFTLISLGISICLGLILRLQLAGLMTQIDSLDLRRVHTHMGFYLFLFPIIWMTFKPKSWRPRSKNLALYFLISTAALMSFLFFGYSTLSKILSGFVLIYWLFYSLVNLTKKRALSGWSHPFYGIILATGSVGSIIYFGVQGDALQASKAVRMFMTCLVWGAFVPLCLEKRNYPKMNLLLWISGVILTALYVLDASFSKSAFIGPIGLSLSILIAIRNKPRTSISRLDLYWLLSSISLLLFGMGIIKNQHYTAIGGLHLILLGPILQSVFEFKKAKKLWLYDSSLLLMVMAISSPGVVPQYYNIMQRVAVGASTVLVFWLIVFLIGLVNSTKKDFSIKLF